MDCIILCVFVYIFYLTSSLIKVRFSNFYLVAEAKFHFRFLFLYFFSLQPSFDMRVIEVTCFCRFHLAWSSISNGNDFRFSFTFPLHLFPQVYSLAAVLLLFSFSESKVEGFQLARLEVPVLLSLSLSVLRKIELVHAPSLPVWPLFSLFMF